MRIISGRLGHCLHGHNHSTSPISPPADTTYKGILFQPISVFQDFIAACTIGNNSMTASLAGAPRPNEELISAHALNTFTLETFSSFGN